MSTAVGRGLRPGGVIRALGRLLLLVAFGFGAGLLVGILAEEPELLAGHLRGEGEAVDLASIERTSDGSSRGTASDERSRIMESGPQEDSARSLPRVSAASVMRATVTRQEPGRSRSAREGAISSERSWAIQVGAFSEESAARRLADSLYAKGYSAELLAAADQSSRWRVRVQPITDESGAREIAAKLKSIERLPTWVLPMDGP